MSQTLTIPVNHFDLLKFCSQKAKEQHNKDINPSKIYDVMFGDKYQDKLAFRYVTSDRVIISYGENGDYDYMHIEDGDNYLEVKI